MRQVSKKKHDELDNVGLKAIQEALLLLPDIRPGEWSENGFLKFSESPAQQIPITNEVVETNLPKKLKGFMPLGVAISRPKDGKTTTFKIENLNPDEPFRRFEDVRVTYKASRKGDAPETRTTIYYKERGENLETLEALAHYFAKNAQFRTRPKSRKTEGFNVFSQWEDTWFEFDQYSAHVQMLPMVESRLGAFGSALRHIILYHAEMAYHLGLRVREAELVDFQSRAAKVRSGGKKGGSLRAKNELIHANTWQGKFAQWLQEEHSQGRVKGWWARRKEKGQSPDSIESLCRYAQECWPHEGFKGSTEKPDQMVSPTPRTLRKIISSFRTRIVSQGA